MLQLLIDLYLCNLYAALSLEVWTYVLWSIFWCKRQVKLGEYVFRCTSYLHIEKLFLLFRLRLQNIAERFTTLSSVLSRQ